MCTVTYATRRAHVRELGIWGCRYQGRRCPQAPHKRGILGCDKGPDERAYAWRAMSLLDGCARRRKKGRNSTEYLFCFFANRYAQRCLGESIEGYETSASTSRNTNRSRTIVP